jgi:pre-mRNA 3'-end-processing factor FIP1
VQPQESKAIKIEAPPQRSVTPSQAPKPPATGTVPQLSTAVSGTAFPAQRTSTIDVNGNPVYPPQGKKLLSIDIDADLANEQKIWRRTGEDQSDYFNYGFDEFTWELYRQRQVAMANTLQGQKNDLAQMQQMMGQAMPGMPSMPGPMQANPGPAGAPSGPGGGGMGPGGMNEQQMEMMMQQMLSQGMDPSQMDFGSFMQMAGQGMGGGPAGPGGQQGGGFQQPHQGGGGRGGRGGRGRGW